MVIDGNYVVSVFTGRGEMKDQFTIKTSGKTLTGTYTSGEMGTLPFKDVKVSGNTIEWTLYFYFPGGTPPKPGLPNPMKIPFKIIIEGNKVTGKLSMPGDTPFDVKGEKVS